MHMLSQFIGENGLSEFVIDGLKQNIVIDMGAMRDILDITHELRKLSLRKTKEIHPESLEELITLIGDLIRSEPPRLTELNLGGIGGFARQGFKLLEAIYESGMQV